MGVVLPDSVFDTNENLYVRMLLYRFFWIKAVVSLPHATFQPYTPTKTSLLFAVKKTRKEADAWDAAWRKASSEYKKLRESPAVRFALENDRTRSALIAEANKAEVEWYPATSLLGATTMPAAIRKAVGAASPRKSNAHKRFAKALRDLHELLHSCILEKLNSGQGKEALARLTALLRDRLPVDASKLKLPDLVEVAYDDILEAAELNYTEDPKGQAYCNAWWCFAEVSSQKSLDNPIFFAEAEHV